LTLMNAKRNPTIARTSVHVPTRLDHMNVNAMLVTLVTALIARTLMSVYSVSIRAQTTRSV
jgi:hypothetical protein